jgi:cadmium resistance protein CadD (predicted permease)
MATVIAAIAIGVTVFVATNIDDIFVLLGFFADPKYRARDAIAGQYLGIGALVLFSLMAALIALIIPPVYAGLLGLAPVFIGMKKLIALYWEDEEAAAAAPRRQNGLFGKAGAVVAVTVANGGDNIGVYTPLFAVRSGFEIAIIIAVFALMTGVWCALARWLVHHRYIGAPIRKYGHVLTPIVLIGIGAMVLREAGAFAIIWR